MTVQALEWDNPGEHWYENGVSRGVLYKPNASGVYDNGIPWNGLTTVTESPSGAESNKQYADNIVYLNLLSAEEFGATLEAFTYPEEFEEHDGSASPVAGLTVAQQGRKPFGLCYRTEKGNEQDAAAGYKLHLVYNALAAPSEKAYSTVNDSPEALGFSWELSTTPVAVGTVGGTYYKPTSLLVADSTKLTAAQMTELENALYGGGSTAAHLPTPAEVITMLTTP